MNKKIIIVSHGLFAKELLNSAEMIIGHQENVSACCYMEGQPLEKYEEEVKKEICEGFNFVLVDLFGGTPFNVVMKLSKHNNLQIITGVNLATLIECVMNRDVLSVDDLFHYLSNIHAQSCRILEHGKEIVYGKN